MRQMNTAYRHSRPPPAIVTAATRLKDAAAAACERTIESLGLSALTAATVHQRDKLLAAQFELNRKTTVFRQVFNQTLDDRLARELRAPGDTPSQTAATWDALSLVGDDELDATVSAERLGLEIGRGCEWELRDLDGFIAPILATIGQLRQENDRNPLRPETTGYALVQAVQAVTSQADIRKLLESDFCRTLTAMMPKVYAAILADFRAAGLQPAAMTVRVSEGPSFDSARPGNQGPRTGFSSSRGGVESSRGDLRSQGLSRAGGPTSESGPTTNGGAGISRAGSFGGDAGGRRGSEGAGRRGGTMGRVDAEMMALMRRLAVIDRGAASTRGSPLDDEGPEGAPADFSIDGHRLAARNVIRAHRDELRQAAGSGMDHMVIDLVGSLFDQILSDAKVPPQMARQIGRLQVPVLRTALGDPSFFSSRKHPVRRFINRLASLATALGGQDDEGGRNFLRHVRELVQGIVDGDFDQADVYERQLAQLEQFVAEQARQELGDDGHTAELLNERETDIRLQQRYAQQLQGELQTLPGPEFVRDFLSAVWSQALVKAVRRHGAESPRAKRMRHAGRELFMSVQAKGTPAQRKDFLIQLPKLMQELNEGMDLIGWPEAAKKTFFGLLLPAHAQSLKGEGLSTLDFNLLAKQVDQVFDRPLPTQTDLPHTNDAAAVDEQAILPSFSAEETQRLGLVTEAAVDWSSSIDIDLSAEVPLHAADIAIQGLPAPDPVEPTQGRSLAEHVQIGFAYQMHIDGKWEKVRLNQVSPGRTFFVFTRGQRHKQIISMTHRMLTRLCDSGRMRAFESAYLIERATARARRQLAALRPTAPAH